MSLHEQIVAEMQRFIDEREDCAVLSPTVLAMVAYDKFAPANLEPHIQYGCIEHFKGIGRGVLRGRFEEASENNPAFAEQGEMFSGKLQERYAVPRKRGEDPQYKRREELTMEEREKIADRFRRCGRAWIDHGAALIAEGRERYAAYCRGMSHLTPIFDVWGSNAEALATDIGESGVTVRQWRNRNNIPPKYWPRIIAEAARKGVALEWTQFVAPTDLAEHSAQGAAA